MKTSIDDYAFSTMADFEKAMAEKFEFACRNLVVPPIKGEITQGKIRWRGLRLEVGELNVEHIQGNEFTITQEMHLYQRGQKIF